MVLRIQIYNRRHRRQESVLTRLKLGYCALNKTLKMNTRQAFVKDVRKSRQLGTEREMMRNNMRELGMLEF